MGAGLGLPAWQVMVKGTAIERTGFGGFILAVAECVTVNIRASLSGRGFRCMMVVNSIQLFNCCSFFSRKILLLLCGNSSVCLATSI